MKKKDLTALHIQCLRPGEPCKCNGFTIYYEGGLYEVYHKSQAELSDPDPVLETMTSEEVINYVTNPPEQFKKAKSTEPKVIIEDHIQLTALINKLSPLTKHQITLSRLTWLCAYLYAEEFGDMGQKEIARMLDHGNITGFHNLKDVDDYITDSELTEKKWTKILIDFGYTPEFEYGPKTNT